MTPGDHSPPEVGVGSDPHSSDHIAKSYEDQIISLFQNDPPDIVPPFLHKPPNNRTSTQRRDIADHYSWRFAE